MVWSLHAEKPQGFEAYQKETLVCRWKKITWWRTSNAQQKRGEDFLQQRYCIKNDYSKDRDDGLPIHDKDLMMTEEVPHGYVPV
jgi:hypothetical protein